MSSLGQAPVIYATAVAVDSHDMKPDSVEKVFNEGGAREFLSSHKWPVGLQDTFISNLHNISHRFFICDDSGSMSENDGHNVVGGPNEASKRLVSCSRWAELTTSLRFHASLADATCSPTEFRLLNQGNPVMLGTGRHGESVNQSKFAALLSGNPTNGTPLCRHIKEIVREIQRLEPSLRAQGQRALLVIATDGEASDGDVAEALRPLKNLPVWVMVRLCTDQDRIVDYWNDIDKELELSMDVVDDMYGEAKEIRKFNKWITYGEPLQRLREFGLSVKELDLLDERPLSLEEVRKVCSFIYGGTQDNYPHPQVDFAGFLAAIDRENLKCGAGIWNPVTQTVRPWIETRALKAAFKTGSCACVIA